MHTQAKFSPLKSTWLPALMVGGLAALGSASASADTVMRPVITGGAPTMITTGAVCPKCGRIHAAASSPVRQVSATRPASSGRWSAGRGVSNVLSALNAQRARQGLRGLQYDPQLQAVAQRRASQMAATGQKSHPPGSFSPGRYEGVGWSSSYSPSGVSACYTSDPNMRTAGAAMATGRDGVYFCVVYR